MRNQEKSIYLHFIIEAPDSKSVLDSTSIPKLCSLHPKENLVCTNIKCSVITQKGNFWLVTATYDQRIPLTTATENLEAAGVKCY